jgi:lysophospholipase L1-like esterase
MSHLFSHLSPRTAGVLLTLTFSSAFAGCGSDQAASPGTQTAGRGPLDASAGAIASSGGATSGATGTGSSGAGAAAAAGPGASGGGSSPAAGAGPSSVAGAASQAGGAGHSAAGASSAAGAGAGGSAAGASAAGSGNSSGGSGGVQPNVSVWIAGDSTVANGGPCPIGWGGQFKALFNAKVAVTNSAVGGRSVRTWLYDVLDTKDSTGECDLGKDAQGNPTLQARWTAMLTGMKTGDYLFIQFGINDGDSTCPRHVGASAFKTSYGLLAQAAKDRGAQPIFVTPVSQIACTGSTVSKGTREPYVTATKDAGTQFGVPVIDLNALSTTLYQALGFCPIPGGSDISASTTGAVGSFFCDDHTHFDTPGAQQIAALVAQALRDQNIGLSAYLK